MTSDPRKRYIDAAQAVGRYRAGIHQLLEDGERMAVIREANFDMNEAARIWNERHPKKGVVTGPITMPLHYQIAREEVTGFVGEQIELDRAMRAQDAVERNHFVEQMAGIPSTDMERTPFVHAYGPMNPDARMTDALNGPGSVLGVIERPQEIAIAREVQQKALDRVAQSGRRAADYAQRLGASTKERST